MTSEAEVLRNIIQRRRSVMPPVYNDKKIDRTTLEVIIDSANYAPTHKLTQPWHFIVFTGESLKELGREIARLYKLHTSPEKFSERKMTDMEQKPARSAAVIAIVMESHPHLLPEWEEIASTATAVENMWLMATALGIGSYWSTPGIINHLQPFLSLSDNQKCIGLFYMGYTDVELPASKMEDISTKVQWRE